MGNSRIGAFYGYGSVILAQWQLYSIGLNGLAYPTELQRWGLSHGT